MESECYFCATRYMMKTTICYTCGHEGLIGPVRHLPLSRLANLPEVASARELVRRDFEVVASPAYPSLHFGAGCFAIIHGPPGGGKSTMATLLVKNQKAVYLSAEEGLGGTLTERLKRLNIRDEKALFVGRISVDQLLELVSKHRPDWLILDSLQMTTFAPSEIRRFSNTMPVKIIVGVSQETKSGVARGSFEFTHEADLIVRVNSMKWIVEKSRYQFPISGSVIEEN